MLNRRTTPGAIVLGSLAFVLCAGYLVALSWAMQRATYDIWGGMVIMPLLVGVTIPLVIRSARAEGNNKLALVLGAAVVAKLVVGTLARYAVVSEVYLGSADAQGYHGAGRAIGAVFRNGSLSVDLGSGGEGTQAINLVTGLVYTVIGPTKLGGFLVFSWLAFLGLFLFYRAYRVALPDGNHLRYAGLLFFLPTLVFWPSSLGKESWMTFTLGLSAFGAAGMLARRRGAFVFLLLGLLGTVVVRPHMAVLVCAGLAIAYLLRRAPAVSSSKPIVRSRAVGIVAVAVLSILVAGSFQRFFKLESLNSDAVEQLLEQTTERTTKGGGSDYDPVRLANAPWRFPEAAVAVLFRPFPFEANNAQALATSFEGVLLVGLLGWRRRNVAAALRSLLRSPYLVLAVVYTVLFIVGFSSIGNFGILARQRSLVYPLVLILLTVERKPEELGSGAEAIPDSGHIRQVGHTPVQPRPSSMADT